MDGAQQLELSPEEMRELVFIPGLSTQEVGSAFSGTGVGMSAVRNQLRRFGSDIVMDPRVREGVRWMIHFISPKRS